MPADSRTEERRAAESLKRLLELCGYQVAVAHSGREAFSEARKLQPHVVLCDIGLPDTDGYAIGSVLRQNSETAAARLIAVTAYRQPQDRRRALAAGFDDKPVDPRVLIGEIDFA